MTYWSFFDRNLVGLVDFAGSKFQRMANWPSFDFFIETGRLFRGIILPVSIFLSKLGQLAIRWDSSLQNWPIPLDSFRKLTSSSLRDPGTFSNVPGRKACQSIEKSCFVFWNDNCWPYVTPSRMLLRSSPYWGGQNLTAMELSEYQIQMYTGMWLWIPGIWYHGCTMLTAVNIVTWLPLPFYFIATDAKYSLVYQYVREEHTLAYVRLLLKSKVDSSTHGSWLLYLTGWYYTILLLVMLVGVRVFDFFFQIFLIFFPWYSRWYVNAIYINN